VIRVHPDARIELRAAWLWYGEVSDKLAAGFQDEIDAAMAAIAEGPERWPRDKFDTRRYVVRRFKFVLVYRVLGDDILIYAAAHGRRRPEFWVARLDDAF
jgi:toxin ParE1/3/4